MRELWEEEVLPVQLRQSLLTSAELSENSLHRHSCRALWPGKMAQTQSKHVLLHWERSPPLAIIAAGQIAGVSIEVRADPKFGKDSVPILHLQSSR